jgi:hypothetical protein
VVGIYLGTYLVSNVIAYQPGAKLNSRQKPPPSPPAIGVDQDGQWTSSTDYCSCVLMVGVVVVVGRVL